MRHWLALGRLGLLFIAITYLATEAGLFLRAGQESGSARGWAQPVLSSNQLDLPFSGINIALEQYEDSQRPEVLQRLRASGFGWVRQRLSWADLEPQPGEFQWQISDPIVTSILRSDLIPIIVLHGSPEWARGEQDIGQAGSDHAPPADPATFAAFAAAFAQRYQDQVRYYQVWDEPNIEPYWGNHRIEPVGYAQLLIAASAAIRAADTDAVIIAAALAPTSDRGHTAIDEDYYLQRLYAAGAAPFFDIVAAQPFGFGHSPGDSRQQIDILNFQRIVLVRRTLSAAGDDTKPVIGARFGWNTRLSSPWATVRPELQTHFAREALDIAYTDWPWLIGLGWAIDQPNAPAEDPMWGFSLTPSVATEFRRFLASTEEGSQPPTPLRTLSVANNPIWVWSILFAALLFSAWRTHAAFHLLPWNLWLMRFRQAPVVAHLLAWSALIALYYSATSAPVIVLCWLGAMFLVAAFPPVGLWLAAATLPFYHQHKELHLVNTSLLIPPAHAALLCLLPVIVYAVRPKQLLSNSWNRLALAWLVLSLLTSVNVWHWPGYWQGLVELALVPVLLFLATQVLIKTSWQQRQLLIAIFAGGLLVAVIGLFSWTQGGGTQADSILRLVGPHFSPNHTALYLERCLFVGLALVFAAHGPMRKWWLAASLLVGTALLLTGSRGALLLALPIGSAVMAAQMWRGKSASWRHLPIDRKALTGLLLLLLCAITLAVWVYWDRLSNSATITQRFSLWQTAIHLWQDFPMLGVAPGGYFWRFPAYIPPPLSLDPNLQHPHNIWLEYATFWGIAGLAWLAVVAAALWSGLRSRARGQDSQQQWLIAAMLAALAAAIAHAQVDAFGALADLAGWNWLALALLTQAISHRKSQSRPFEEAAPTVQIE